MNYSTLYLSNFRSLYSSIVTFARDASALTARWYINYRTRRQLAELNPHQLKDIGVSKGDALEELRKPFWKV